MTSILKLLFQDFKLQPTTILKFNISPLFGICSVIIFSSLTSFGQNQKPKIEGQQPLSTWEEQNITIQLSHLYVTDRDDWFYPWGFSLAVYPGDNYTLSGSTVIPAVNFYGTLSVPVTVNDGKDDSNVYYVQITVANVNDAPVITGQTALSTNPNTSISIQLTHLTVSDPDNSYPSGFSMAVYPGNNYTVVGNTVTPSPGFTGELTVPVAVSDGTNMSAQYGLKIMVKSSTPEIIGQELISINEDEPVIIGFSHLRVQDADDAYPTGFTIAVLPGANYTFEGTKVTPAANFAGNLAVAVTVTDSRGNTSKPYNLTVNIQPVNDAPQIANFETDPLNYAVGKGAVSITNFGEVSDPDSDSMMVAEIGFDAELYRSGEDELLFENTARIKGAFDSRTGVMALFGKASLAEYTQAIRSIKYLSYSVDAGSFGTRKFYINVSDGTTTSPAVERLIKTGEFVADLDIPTGFTPNGDLANDTWKIKPVKNIDDYSNARLRVYTRQGKLVYETRGFGKEWDGRYNGDLLPADVYFYTIELSAAFVRSQLKGVVSILR